MADSDEEDDYAFYGTPLEPFDEDNLPRKKPITVEEQVVTDEHGRRRFHGAFTGGFSAGFFNTVGSLEGWKPSQFKSTRASRADRRVQLPEDFMDDEDTGEFGIAPKLLRAKPEYDSSDRKRKQQRPVFNQGPIPGEPVLKSILQPAKETVGVLLLMKMGWKPGQGVGPRLTRLQKRQTKVYGCAPVEASDAEPHLDPDDEPLDPTTLFAPEDVAPVVFSPKEDTAGLGYRGLDRTSVLGPAPVLFTMRDQHNKKISIAGQAFGVGAFEEEDDDIYCNEDMSSYDFALGSSSSSKKQTGGQLAITDGSADLIQGFCESKRVSKKKFFPPPELPAGFVPIHLVRKSRFTEGPLRNTSSGETLRTPRLDAESRSSALDPDIRIKREIEEETEVRESDPVSNESSSSSRWRPFAADPAKQERYDKFLHFARIGARDAFSRVQPFTMTDCEREREVEEFECAARLYSGGSWAGERFTHGATKEEPQALPPQAEAASARMFGTLTRTVNDWQPDPLVCKRFNIPVPNSCESELATTAKETKKKSRFSVFDFLEASKTKSLSSLVEVKRELEFTIISGVRKTEGTVCDPSSTVEPPLNSEEQIVPEPVPSTSHQSEQVTPPELSPHQALPLNNVTTFEDPPDKMDLFKAIFCSDSEEEEGKEEKKEVEAPKQVNLLRNTSPPRGIFANLDLDSLNRREKTDSDSRKVEASAEERLKDTKETELNLPKDVTDNTRKSPQPSKDKESDLEGLYGPVLPAAPVFSRPRPTLTLEVDDGLWVEATHRHKKDKKKKKDKEKEKHKKKKKKKKRSDSD